MHAFPPIPSWRGGHVPDFFAMSSGRPKSLSSGRFGSLPRGHCQTTCPLSFGILKCAWSSCFWQIPVCLELVLLAYSSVLRVRAFGPITCAKSSRFWAYLKAPEVNAQSVLLGIFPWARSLCFWHRLQANAQSAPASRLLSAKSQGPIRTREPTPEYLWQCCPTAHKSPVSPSEAECLAHVSVL